MFSKAASVKKKMKASRRKEKKVSILDYLTAERAGRVTYYFIRRRILAIL